MRRKKQQDGENLIKKSFIVCIFIFTLSNKIRYLAICRQGRLWDEDQRCLRTFGQKGLLKKTAEEIQL
jgi:hypothetical protein